MRTAAVLDAEHHHPQCPGMQPLTFSSLVHITARKVRRGFSPRIDAIRTACHDAKAPPPAMASVIENGGYGIRDGIREPPLQQCNETPLSTMASLQQGISVARRDRVPCSSTPQR